MDFYQIQMTSTRKGEWIIRPIFQMKRSKDMMVRANSFYAIWNDEKKIWSTDEFTLIDLIDQDLENFARREREHIVAPIIVEGLRNANSKTWTDYNTFLKNMPDTNIQLDNVVTFQNTETVRTDYVSKRLPYSLSDAPCPAYHEIMTTLYEPVELEKIEWAIGSVFAGEGRFIQKFLVLYGEAGSGKSTVLKIIQQLFEGYYTMFEAKMLVGNNNAFSTDTFRSNPLVAIQHDGDLSRIEDNSKLNSIISHEEMQVNEKFKPSYISKMNCFLFMATNRPVKITDAKSGLLRRLIDVRPSGKKIPPDRYYELMNQVSFELGSIANHCLQVYRSMGKIYYDRYIPFAMTEQTDPFYNFIEENYLELKNAKNITLKRAWALYKEYFERSALRYDMPMFKFREELKNYYEKFYNLKTVDGRQTRSYYEGFLYRKIRGYEDYQEETNLSPSEPVKKDISAPDWLEGLVTGNGAKSIFDTIAADCPAQYATANDVPQKSWNQVTTVLNELDTSKLHYVRVPIEHIVIDFDLKDQNQNKSLERNLEAAAKWPKTYAELSKGGQGIHLHYIYEGDPEKLSRIYEEDIEVKVFTGKSSLRRKLSKCNEEEIAHISSGLPMKGEKAMVNFEGCKNEKAIRTLILRNLSKEYHANTAPSVQFIYKILEDAYQSGVVYDVTDLRPKVMAFANNSSHQALNCLRLVNKMKWKSETVHEEEESTEEEPMVFFDVEVFPNLFLVNYKVAGPDKQCVRMINPSPEDIEQLMRFRLVGFNCRRYDNHILYARYMGYSNLELFELSQRIVSADKRDDNQRNCFFREAYNLSYTDVYDFASAGNKQSLKKWEIELGIHHQELGLPWDEPVPEDQWVKVAEYCDNDVISTEAVFNHLHGDWLARQMLAKMAGMTVNDTTNTLTTRFIFGENRKPQLVYTDLATGKQDISGYESDYINSFPGYEYAYSDDDKKYHNMFRGEDVGRGGYVWARPGIYHNVITFDVRGMHPSSIIAMNYFGEYTKRFAEIVNVRTLIKHKDYDSASKMLDGMLAPYLTNPDDAKAVSNALKTAVNSCYGLSSATFENAMRHPLNRNNIVALRGALFMVTLRDEIIARGGVPFHIKTDSVKVENPSKELADFIFGFAKQYGYEFEIEHKFEKICLVNNAVYIGKLAEDDPEDPSKWTATGAQFAQPFVFKTLFSHDPLTFKDLTETKEVKTAIYLDMNENLPEDEHCYHFVGKVGSFCPIKPNCGGGLLVAKRGEKYNAVTNSTGYRWLESELVHSGAKEDSIDLRYFRGLVDDAIEQIGKYGDAEAFISDDSSEPIYAALPWCDEEDCQSCADRDDCQSMAASFVTH